MHAELTISLEWGIRGEESAHKSEKKRGKVLSKQSSVDGQPLEGAVVDKKKKGHRDGGNSAKRRDLEEN